MDEHDEVGEERGEEDDEIEEGTKKEDVYVREKESNRSCFAEPDNIMCLFWCTSLLFDCSFV